MSKEHASSPQKKSPEGGKKAGKGFDIFDILAGPGLGGAIRMLGEVTTPEQVTKFLEKATDPLTGFFGAPFEGKGGGGGGSAAAKAKA